MPPLEARGENGTGGEGDLQKRPKPLLRRNHWPISG